MPWKCVSVPKVSGCHPLKCALSNHSVLSSTLALPAKRARQVMTGMPDWAGFPFLVSHASLAHPPVPSTSSAEILSLRLPSVTTTKFTTFVYPPLSSSRNHLRLSTSHSSLLLSRLQVLVVLSIERPLKSWVQRITSRIRKVDTLSPAP